MILFISSKFSCKFFGFGPLTLIGLLFALIYFCVHLFSRTTFLCFLHGFNFANKASLISLLFKLFGHLSFTQVLSAHSSQQLLNFTVVDILLLSTLFFRYILAVYNCAFFM